MAESQRDISPINAPLSKGVSLEEDLAANGKSPSPTPRTKSRRFSFSALKNAVTTKIIGGGAEDACDWQVDKLPANFFDLKANDSKGMEFPINQLHGQVCLVVNVASF